MNDELLILLHRISLGEWMKRPGMHRNETETYKVSGTRGFEDDMYQKASTSIVVCCMSVYVHIEILQ